MESGVSPLLRPYLSLCLAIEYDEDWLEEYAEMVKTVNRNEVDEVDKLSDHIYLCDKTGISLLK